MRALVEVIVIAAAVAVLSGAFVVAGNQAATFYASFEISK